MSNKRYRTPANPGYVSPVLAQAPMAKHDAVAANPVLEQVTAFLGDMLNRITRTLDQAEAMPAGEPSADGVRTDSRQKLIMGLVRIGISAARALIQAVRMTGEDTKHAELTLAKAAERLEERLEKAQPARAGLPRPVVAT